MKNFIFLFITTLIFTTIFVTLVSSNPLQQDWEDSGPYVDAYHIGATQVTHTYKWTAGAYPKQVKDSTKPAKFQTIAKTIIKCKGVGYYVVQHWGTLSYPVNQTRNFPPTKREGFVNHLPESVDTQEEFDALSYEEYYVKKVYNCTAREADEEWALSVTGRCMAVRTGIEVIGATILGIGGTVKNKAGVSLSMSWGSEYSDSDSVTITEKDETLTEYECSHTGCTAKLPSTTYHLELCLQSSMPPPPYLQNMSVEGCGQPYWICSSDASNHTNWSTCRNPNDTHGYRSCVAYNRRSETCPRDSDGQRCNYHSYYVCSPHTHDYSSGSGLQQDGNGGGGIGQTPGNGGGPPLANGGCDTNGNNGNGNNGNGNNGSGDGAPVASGGCTTTPTLVNCHRHGTAGGYERCYVKVSNAYEHQVTCPGCDDEYWTCNSSDLAEHGLRSCTRQIQPGGSPCNNQWRRCGYDPYPINGGTEILNAAPRCPTSTIYLECIGPVLP